MLIQPLKTPQMKQSTALSCWHRFKRLHCARASLKQTRLTCSVLSYSGMQLIGDQKEACASTSLKQFRLTCLLQFHTQMPKKEMPHKHFYTVLLHTNTFTRKRFYTQTLLHTNPFTHNPFLHTIAFTHKNVYTQTLVHRNTSRHKRFYTPTLLNTSRHF